MYVVDYSNNRVQKFNGTGSYITQWGSFGTGDGKFNRPIGIAVDLSANVYVTDYENNRVQMFTSTGIYIRQWGLHGSDPGQFKNPYGVAVDRSGNVYVVDSGNNRVELFGDCQLENHGYSLILLQAGWNLVSLPTLPDNPSMPSVLQSVISKVSIVWTYLATSKTWSFYKPGPPASGTLKAMRDGAGYWILMTSGGVWNVTGTVIPVGASLPPTYQLTAGWNLVGFKSEPWVGGEKVSQYLASLTGSYDANSVWIYDSASGTWVRAPSSMWLEPGQAFWIYMNTAEVLIPE